MRRSDLKSDPEQDERRITRSAVIQEHTLKNGYSLAQLNMGRRLKSRVPCHPDELIPCTLDVDLVHKKEKEYRKQMQTSYDRRHKATKEADELSPYDQGCKRCLEW